jgi:hypothetical protein
MFHEVPKKWTHSSKCETKRKLYIRVILKTTLSLGLSWDLQSFDLSLQSSIYKDKTFKNQHETCTIFTSSLSCSCHLSFSLTQHTKFHQFQQPLSLSLSTQHKYTKFQKKKFKSSLPITIVLAPTCHTQKSPKKTKKPPI